MPFCMRVHVCVCVWICTECTCMRIFSCGVVCVCVIVCMTPYIAHTCMFYVSGCLQVQYSYVYNVHRCDSVGMLMSV